METVNSLNIFILLVNFNYCIYRKVFKKLGFALAEDVLRSICTCRPWAIEQMLMMLRIKIDKHIFEGERENRELQPEVDQRGIIQMTSEIL